VTERSALQTAAAIRSGETSAILECEAAIARIEARDGPINAVVVRDFDRARDAAREADRRLASGDTAPFLGVPMTVKESFNIAGLPTSWGFAEYRENIATEDAVAVKRLKAAGAVILGKTNIPVGLADLQANNPNYGRTRNPANPDRVSGGSSGGAAAALAAGMVPIELGSDIGGSIRVPAPFCGVWGHKATYGMLSGDGHNFPGTNGASIAMGVIGPMARDGDDLAAELAVLANIPLPRAPDRAPGEWRILLMTGHPLARTSAAIAGALESLGRAFAEAGATVDRATDLLPDLETQHRNYMHLLNIAMTRGAATADRPAPTLAEWFNLIDDQARCKRAWNRLFASYDAVIAPALGTTAFPHDDTPLAQRQLMIDGDITPFGVQFAFPGLATFPMLPATSVPIGTDADGMPIGVQVIADTYQDHIAIAVARAAHDLVWST